VTTPPAAFDAPPERTTALPRPKFSPAEKAAGKRFRDDQTAALLASVEEQKAAVKPGDPVFEVYTDEEQIPSRSMLRAVEVTDIPAGRFGFWWKTGKCSCGQRATSKVGKFEDAYLRPPLQGRVARRS
jgi:hypothetical protein